MSLIRSRAVLTGTLCAASVAMVGGSIAVATTPPEDTSTGTTESSPPSSGSAVTETSDATAPDGGGVQILPPDELWAGATRGEWDARWWQWAASMPEEVNPNFDTTGERCGYGQSGPVFFTPASFTFEPNEPGFTCVVAEGTAIYVSVIGTECSTVEPPPFFGRDEDELRACATAGVDGVTEFSATVNGQDVGDLEAYRTSSPLFTLTLAENNLFGVEPGVAQAVSEGYSFIIAPPPPGEYEITGSTQLAGEPEPFSLTITVVVEAPQVIEPPSTGPGSTGPIDSPPPPPETTEPVDTTLPPDGGQPLHADTPLSEGVRYAVPEFSEELSLQLASPVDGIIARSHTGFFGVYNDADALDVIVEIIELEHAEVFVEQTFDINNLPNGDFSPAMFAPVPAEVLDWFATRPGVSASELENTNLFGFPAQSLTYTIGEVDGGTPCFPDNEAACLGWFATSSVIVVWLPGYSGTLYEVEVPGHELLVNVRDRPNAHEVLAELEIRLPDGDETTEPVDPTLPPTSVAAETTAPA